MKRYLAFTVAWVAIGLAALVALPTSAVASFDWDDIPSAYVGCVDTLADRAESQWNVVLDSYSPGELAEYGLVAPTLFDLAVACESATRHRAVECDAALAHALPVLTDSYRALCMRGDAIEGAGSAPSVTHAAYVAVIGPLLPACAEEDGSGGAIPCYWDATTRGNRVGTSYVVSVAP